MTEARIIIDAVGFTAGRTFVLKAGETKVLGRGPGADFKLDDPSLAPQHAAIVFAPPRSLQVVHLAGAPLLVNGKPQKPRHPAEVRPGDAIALGPLALRVEVVGGALEAPPSADRPNTLKRLQKMAVGEYDIERELGQGALGRVFAAVRRSDGLPVAIKVLHGSVAEGTADHARFLREGQLAKAIDSPFIVKVLDAATDKGRAYIVMERVEGTTLRALIAARPLSVPDALRYGEELARALTAAARAGVVHRDVKPANVFVTTSGASKLGDFGAARAVEGGTGVTATGQGLGSSGYMAPEQVADAKRVDARADVYALGATLYHLLTGQPPFSPRNVSDLMALMTKAPRPLRELRPDVPDALAALVHELLAKTPDARPPAWQVVERLAELR
jgi:serine/threonine protein kinase